MRTKHQIFAVFEVSFLMVDWFVLRPQWPKCSLITQGSGAGEDARDREVLRTKQRRLIGGIGQGQPAD